MLLCAALSALFLLTLAGEAWAQQVPDKPVMTAKRDGGTGIKWTWAADDNGSAITK